MKSAKTHALFAVLPIAVAFHGSHAFAQGSYPDCSTLDNPIYMTGTTAVEPLVRELGAKLRQLTPQQTLLWNQTKDGCGAVNELAFSDNTAAYLSLFNYYEEPPAAQVEGGPPKISTVTCSANLTYPADLVINDIFWPSCSEASSAQSLASLPADYMEFQGPVQGLVPIVLNSYYYYSDITAEELLDVFGCGARGSILTFSYNSTIFDYCYNSGMKALWANSLGQPVTAFNAPTNNTSCPSAIGMVTLLETSGTADTDIAYTSTEAYDENRGNVRALKVRGLNQNLAYFPDSDITSRDKINIREGRYTIQSALKLVAHVTAMDAGGPPQPDNPAAKRMIDWLQGNPVQDPSLQLPFDIIDVYAQSGVVPQCAMKVTKDTDAPQFRPYQPANPCSCYFQIQATGAASIPGCVPCQDSSTCPTGTACYFHGIPAQGYCE